MGYLDDLSDEEFRAEVARTRGEKHEIEMKLSRLHGQVDAIVDRLAADPEFQLCLRGQAWIDSGREIGRDRERDLPTGVPDGWPEGIDGEAYIAEWAAGEKAKRSLDLQPDPDPAEADGPLTSRFRKLLRGKP